MSVVSGTTTIEGRYKDAASAGVATFTGFKLCGVNTNVQLRFVSELFDYTHPTSFAVTAAAPSQVNSNTHQHHGLIS